MRLGHGCQELLLVLACNKALTNFASRLHLQGQVKMHLPNLLLSELHVGDEFTA